MCVHSLFIYCLFVNIEAAAQRTVQNPPKLNEKAIIKMNKIKESLFKGLFSKIMILFWLIFHFAVEQLCFLISVSAVPRVSCWLLCDVYQLLSLFPIYISISLSLSVQFSNYSRLKPLQHPQLVSACFPPHGYVMPRSTPDPHTHTGRWDSVHVYQSIKLQYSNRRIDDLTLIAHNIVIYKSPSYASYCVSDKLHCF